MRLRFITHPRTLVVAGRVFVTIAIVTGFIAQSTQQQWATGVEAQRQTAMGTWVGSSFPVENFQAYTSPFGVRQPADGSPGSEYHRGLDMAAPLGSYIRNWWTGKVVEVSDDSACGTSIVVQSGQWEHIYCHMQGRVEKDNRGRYMIDREGGIQVWEGQTVVAGTRIGRVGMTGRTTGPHLHWGLKFAGQWVDPALVLRAMYGEQTRRGAVSAKP
jgi:murein DD-endopeptidase MepM/ murein hydrolase activator NlpD